jgi:hypothetical protein
VCVCVRVRGVTFDAFCFDACDFLLTLLPVLLRCGMSSHFFPFVAPSIALRRRIIVESSVIVSGVIMKRFVADT